MFGRVDPVEWKKVEGVKEKDRGHKMSGKRVVDDTQKLKLHIEHALNL